tara:strand:- start:54 stop:1058 length:1005 start_codon:yes stop_codon:yes gene_type:complete
MKSSKLINPNEIIYLAGSSGMVGRSLLRLLKESSYGLEKYGGKLLTPSRKELDLLNTEEVNNWFDKNKPSIVILAAAKVGGIYANANFPADFLYENLKIQMNVIEAAWKNRVKRFLFLGSSCIYPKYARQPIEEESLLTKSLESTNEWYAISKISGIKLLQALRKQYNFDAISLMPTNLYGTGDNYHPTNSHVIASLINKFCNAVKFSEREVVCWGTGNVLREFLHVDDLSRAILFALENWDPSSVGAPAYINNEPYTFLNVGSGEEIYIKDLSEMIAKKVGFKGKIIWDQTKPDGTPRKLLNIEKIREMGWGHKISLDEGLNRTIKEFQDNNF